MIGLNGFLNAPTVAEVSASAAPSHSNDCISDCCGGFHLRYGWMRTLTSVDSAGAHPAAYASSGVFSVVSSGARNSEKFTLP